MSIVSGTRADSAEQPAVRCGANPTKKADFDQVVVLVRLPYLPQQPVSAQTSLERPVSDPGLAVSTSTQRTEADSLEQADGCQEPCSSSMISKLRAYAVQAVLESEQILHKRRISPTAWKMAGLGGTIVLIFAALALLNGAFDRDAELVSRTSFDPSTAEQQASGLGAFDTAPRLTLAPKPNEIVQKDKQPTEPRHEESSTEKSEEEASPDGSEKGLALADAKLDDKKEPQAEPAEMKSANATAEEQVAELEAPDLEPMTSHEEPVGLVDTLAGSSTDNHPPSSEEAATHQQATSAISSPADVESEQDALPMTASLDTAPPSAETLMTAKQQQDIPGATAEPKLDLSAYPRTDPSTYRYPTRYEDLLSNADEGISDESYPISHPGTSIYGWHPSTVRLQPRIEPPPIR